MADITKDGLLLGGGIRHVIATSREMDYAISLATSQYHAHSK